MLTRHIVVDSELKAWLVKNGYVKSDAQIKREKAESIVAKNWYSAKDTVWSAWSDNNMKQWLIDHGYMRSDAVRHPFPSCFAVSADVTFVRAASQA